jgi:DNA-directed RNA polymerase beta' subunit
MYLKLLFLTQFKFILNISEMNSPIFLSESAIADSEFEEFFSPIKRIEFSLLSSEEIERISVALIDQPKSEGEGSVNDPRLGVIINDVDCVTCGLKNHSCNGHFGHVKFSIPIAHPLFSKEIIHFLSCKCYECKSLLFTVSELKTSKLKRLTGFKKFEAICALIKKEHKTCPKESCNSIQPKYKVDQKKFYRCESTVTSSKDQPILIPTTEILEIFQTYTEIELAILGVLDLKNKTDIHPKNLIFVNFPILPLPSRPFVESNGILCDDDVTIKYLDIVKLNNKLKPFENIKPSLQKKAEKNEYLTKLEEAVHSLMDNSSGKAKHNNNRPLKCIVQRLKGKTGRFRSNLSAKRVDFSARSPIGPDAFLKADEVIIPNQIAKKLTFPERVTELNFKEMEKLLELRKVNYVINEKKERTNMIDYFKPTLKYVKGFKFQSGDILVRRDMVGKMSKKKYDEYLSDLKKDEKDEFNLRLNIKSQCNFEVHRLQSDGTRKKIIPPMTEQIFLTLTEDDLIERIVTDQNKIKEIKNNTLSSHSNYKIKEDETVVQYFDLSNSKNKDFKILQGDKVFRKILNSKDREELQNIIVTYKKPFKLNIGDTVERHLKDGDLIYLNRQPSLHIGSMVAKKVKIYLDGKTGINGNKPIKTIRFSLSDTSHYNADKMKHF